jgi:hypothetical protein
MPRQGYLPGLPRVLAREAQVVGQRRREAHVQFDDVLALCLDEATTSDSFVASATASIATGWSEPVPGRELHPLKPSAFHGALLRQLFKNLLLMPFPRRVLQVRQHCAGVLTWLDATLCATCSSPPDAVSRKRDFAKPSP